jgi:predicted Zn finger-like uncharacterized protein
MPLHAVCPECDAEYNLPDEQEGLRVRCKNCRTVFTVEDTPAAESRPGRGGAVTDRPSPKAKAAAGVTAGSGSARGAAAETALGPEHKHGSLPWIVGGVVACVGFLAIAAIVVAIILRPAPPPAATHQVAVAPPPPVPLPDPYMSPVVTPAPTPPPPNPAPPTTAVAPKPADPPAAAPVTRPSSDGRMTHEARDKVKKATVYIHVTFPDGRQASGSGFFGAPEKPNIILTNAHVVGMLAPESRKPKEVEIVINSGEANMKKTQARVLGVDRNSDLAVLDVGVTDGMPVPLAVKPAASLQELDPVYIFGFPHGKSIGEEITISSTTISSLRKNKRGDSLERIQVNGGMTHGNSGGPVVDGNGDVVGVSVSGIEGTQINFAIPGERVTMILKGRASTVVLGQPYTDGTRVNLPVQVEMIDPQNLVKSVAVEVWTGNRGDPVAASAKEPAPRPGDSPRHRVELPYSAGIARGDVPLPELPRGKVYWLQPLYVSGTETYWVGGEPHDVRPELAVERRPATLRFKQSAGSTRNLTINMKSSFRVSNDEDDEGAVINAGADFKERVASSDGAGFTLRLELGRVKLDATDGKKKLEPDEILGVARANAEANRLVGVARFDSYGNLKEQGMDMAKLMSGPLAGLAPDPAGARPTLPGRRPAQSAAKTEANICAVKQLATFLEPIQHALEMLSIPIPNEDNCPPDKAWSSATERAFPILFPDHPKHYGSAKVQWTYTYVGQRTRNGKPEAVIAMDGVLHGKGGSESAIGGTVAGTAVVDLATGVATSVETRTVMDTELPDRSSGKSVRLIATIVTKLSREF